MDKKLILSVAGSGKTYTLCKEIDVTKRNLILAYTNENIRNLNAEVIAHKGCIPDNFLIMTFDSFLLNYVALPYAKVVANTQDKNYLFDSYRCAYNLNLPPYWKTGMAQYMTSTGIFYGELIPKFINKFDLMTKALFSINKHFDRVYIDEAQDFAGERFDILKTIIHGVRNIFLVGDYYQHSVSTKIDMKKQPFVKSMTYKKYKKLFENMGVGIDETTLVKSRRCPINICNLVSAKLNINIESEGINNGEVFFISTKEEALRIINDDSIIKLKYDDSRKCSFRAMNWSYSKGDTFSNVCVILTQTLKDFTKDDFVYKGSEITKNEFYVALTRTKGNLYILTDKLYKEYIAIPNTL